ncbi:family 78 glycoside hydrolase catalytic domain [Microbacter sp. GSS18]|nr:family 78 glycoside hydrolase catalytic domain [Microbacter sp. GSS18]
MTTPRCADLRVEHLTRPIGVGVAHPRFTWTVGQADAVHELEVAELDAGDDSGPVWRHEGSGAAGVPVVYAGPPLRSNTVYRWRVRSRHEGEPTPWAVSTFTTALLDSVDWSASWVRPVQQPTLVERWSIVDWIRGGGPSAPPEERLRPVQLLRQPFRVAGGLVRARLYATAHGVYSAWVNGSRAGDEVLAPGFDSYEHRLSVQVYDVTAALGEGENVLALALADGWWAGRIGLTGSSAQFGDTTEAIWQLHLDYADGRSGLVTSGADVRSATGSWVYADLFVGEMVDRRAEPQGWRLVGFDDAAWTPVEAIGADVGTLVPFSGEPVRRVAELPAGSVRDTPEGAVVDFGQVIAGRVRLRMRGTAPGQRIVIEHTETLDGAGEWFDNIVGIDKDQSDVFVSAGGDDEWEPEFTFHGFRYARVRGLTEPLAADDVIAVVISSDLEQTGAFASSDERLNRLHDNVVWSQRANFLSIPTDCPQRERAGWTGDAQVFAAAATNNAHVVPFLSRWLDNLRADQRADGAVAITSPYSPFDAEAAASAEGIGSIVAAAGWSDAIAFVPWTLYERYGDERVLSENYDAALRWIRHQRSRARAELPAHLDAGELSPQRIAAQRLLFNTGMHFGDWLTPSTMEGRPLHEAIGMAPALTSELIAPMFQAQTLTLGARMATVLGRDEDASALAGEAEAVRQAFAAEYVDAEGRLPVELQGPYVIALAFGMIPEDRVAGAADELVRLVHARGDRLDTGFLSVPYLLDVLWDAGHRDLARTLLWQDQAPSWLYEVDQGATTIWESWDAIAPDGTVRPVSLNHYAFGCVDDWLYRRIAGIQPTAPGYRTARVAPDLESGLTHVSAHVGTPAGRLSVDWRLDGDRAVIAVTVPPGIDAVLEVDRTSISLPAGTSAHTHFLDSRSFLTEAPR